MVVVWILAFEVVWISQHDGCSQFLSLGASVLCMEVRPHRRVLNKASINVTYMLVLDRAVTCVGPASEVNLRLMA